MSTTLALNRSPLFAHRALERRIPAGSLQTLGSSRHRHRAATCSRFAKAIIRRGSRLFVEPDPGGARSVPRRAAPHRTGPLPPASSWPGRCAGRWWLRSRGTCGRSRRRSIRRSTATSAPHAHRGTAPVAGGKNQAQQLVAKIIVHGGLDVLGAGVALVRQIVADLGMLAREHPVAAQRVDGGAWPRPSARRLGSPERRSSAIPTGPSPVRPARALPPTPCRARVASSRQSASPARSGRRSRLSGGYRPAPPPPLKGGARGKASGGNRKAQRLATFSRSCSSCLASSGVTASPKSAIS